MSEPSWVAKGSPLQRLTRFSRRHRGSTDLVIYVAFCALCLGVAQLVVWLAK